MKVVRKVDRASTALNDIKMGHFTPRIGLRMMDVVFPPIALTGEEHAHEGKEIHLVIKETVLF